MIVNIKTNKAGMVKANFEAMKFGLEFEPYADNTFDVTVYDNVVLDHILKKCNGTITRQEFTQSGGV
jgi:hypothetical protein